MPDEAKPTPFLPLQLVHCLVSGHKWVMSKTRQVTLPACDAGCAGECRAFQLYVMPPGPRCGRDEWGTLTCLVRALASCGGTRNRESLRLT